MVKVRNGEKIVVNLCLIFSDYVRRFERIGGIGIVGI